jgi:ubiquinone/menaquinone biosynthesis C-methylase UbiE
MHLIRCFHGKITLLSGVSKILGENELRKMEGSEFDELVTFFDNMAQTNWLGKLHNRLIELSGDWTNKNVLDVGSGTGRLLLRGVNKTKTVSGIDLSEGMVQKSKKIYADQKITHKSNFKVGDACHLPYSDETFDISLSTCVMFLLPKPEEGLTEILRVTKTGGNLAFLNPSFYMSVENAEKYANKHGLEGFEKETLLKWANAAKKRHRYKSEQFHELLLKCGATSADSEEHLDGLALITYATK